ncbi:hypothetical protein D1007_48941 [Hordeum vulgare]|nr:hypothetical protein D1007_48941 [Hordeum vulgare]
MAVVAGGCAELRAVCRPVEVRGVATVMADAESAHSEAVEHGHAMRVGSATATADLRGGVEAAVARRGSMVWRRSRSCGG